MPLRILSVLAVVFTCLPVCQGVCEEPPSLNLDRIYNSSDFDERSVGSKWLPKLPDRGSSYSVLEPTEEGGSGNGIVGYDAATGNRTILVAASELVPPGKTEALSVDGYQWSRDLSRVLIYTNSVRVWRQNTRGDYWLLDRGTGQLTKLGADGPPQSMMYAKFSPGGNRVAFVREGNLFVQDLVDHSIRQITTRTNERILNGASDWVYEEEFGLRDAFRWSPDGDRIAFWHFDTTGVQDFTIINNTDSLYPTVETFAYPKAGTRNSAVRIGIVELARSTIHWVDLPGDPRETYIPRIEWIDKTGALLIRQMNRLQNRESFYLVDVASGEKRLVHTETDPAWIDLQDQLYFDAGNQTFFYLSDRDGWRHVYRISVTDGGDPNTAPRSVEPSGAPLTRGDFDVIDLLGVVPNDSDGGESVYLIASPDSATDRFLYRANTANGKLQRVTPASAEGVHHYDLAPHGDFAIHRFSTANTPSTTEVVSLPDHQIVRVLEDNQKLAERLQALDLPPVEFFRIDIGPTSLDAWSISPKQLEPGKRYPLLVQVYGEPAGSTVVNRWGGTTSLWHRMMADNGYVVVSIDNRGSNVPRGRHFRKTVYRRLGTLGPDDQAAAVRQLLSERPNLDPQRIGTWGWSGGGTSSLHSIFRYPDLYRTAVAIAPVANLRYYDTIYEERYMGLPSDNVEGYRSGSPIHFVEQFQGNLLLIHGTADDNVHYQVTELLINELIARNKQFDLFIYPGRTHSIRERKNTRMHLMTLVTEYLLENLPAGGVAASKEP
ncbi:S9 family peptidase [Roseiconus nitratireducens]|uniref:S9 family peptidase n=1 Tax=Roseiconus nitratireducens TaxID=2605748 RepID=A0A5M6DFG4_9BACT|nr:S9 family peptidase [Roseiconus nitratireducens]KAA5545146.1 S9 family peptidase [Roseiconus nitratireducens]